MDEQLVSYYHIDAFTSHLFAGNPAGVCRLTEELPDDVQQRIAAEMNLSETAFISGPRDGIYGLRWFTPMMEVDLCGHATLAVAHVLWRHEGVTEDSLSFQTRSGLLRVSRGGADLITLDFPARVAVAIDAPADVAEALGVRPLWCGKARDYLFVLEDEKAVRKLKPDFARLATWDTFGIIVTARGEECDFVSRFFAPRAGIAEDPVTGSAHCTLVPFWTERLGKSVLHARQVSARGGELFCELVGERVKIGGRAVTFFETELRVDVCSWKRKGITE